MAGSKINEFDTRTLTLKIRNGSITKVQLDSFTKSLKDTTGNADYFKVQEETAHASATSADLSPTFDSIEMSE